MIRVAHFLHTSGPGGAETVLVTLAQGLDRNRFESIPCIRQNSWMHNQLQDSGCDFHFLRESGSYDVRFVAHLIKFLKERHIDIVHSHEFFMNFYGAMAARAAGIPSIATVHGKVEYVAAKLRRRLACRLVSSAGCTVTVSNQLAARCHEEIGIPARRMRTIYNGIDLERFREAEGLESLRAELGLSEDAPLVGMVGNLYPVKGYPVFIRAMELVHRALPSAQFIVCGRGTLQQELQSLARSCDLESSLRFLGFRPDVPRLLQLMDVFVLSSLSEGLSLSILEAMAAGRPTVVTDVGGNREIAVEAQTGFIIPPENAEAIAEKVLLLLRDKQLARRMGLQGRQRVQSLFSREMMIGNYQRLYEDLILNGRGET